MAEVAKTKAAAGQEVTTSEIAAFAETAPGVATILGWLAGRLDLYVYLARADGAPTHHAGRERDGEATIAPIPGEQFSLCAVGSVEPDVLAQVALILGAAMAREQAAVMIEAKSHGDLLRTLISGDEGAIAHAQGQGWELAREVFVLIARCDVGSISELADEWRRLIRQRDPKAIVVYFPHEVVAIVSKESLDPQAFAGSLPRHGGSVGVSAIGMANADLGALYGQADLAISVMRSLGRTDEVSNLDSLGAYRLLSLISDSEALRQFLGDTLKELASRSDIEAVDLRRTLQTLLDHNLNIAEAARALHFHYNTLRYRITKLEKMLGKFTEDAELRLALSLALRILSLRGI